MRILALALLLTGCAGQWKFIDTELEPMYSSFLEEAEVRNIKLQNTKRITVLFLEDLPETYVGICYNYGNMAEVYILKSFWETATDTQRQLIMYHELGHCLCNLKHDDTHLNIMNTFLPNDNYYSTNMVDNLFNACKANL